MRLLARIRGVLENWYVAIPVWLIVKFPRRILADSALAERILTLRLRNGGRLRCRVNEFVPFVETFVLGHYDIPRLDWSRVRTIIDVGANVGVATVWFAERASRARIVAVEPGSKAQSLLAWNTESLRPRVEIVAAALGAESGVGILHSPRASVEASVTPGPGGRVKIMTLDELLSARRIDSVDLLKLDCEGAEFPILTTASKATLGRIGSIVGEYHEFVDGNTAEVLKRCLEASGFTVTLRTHWREARLGTFIAERPS